MCCDEWRQSCGRWCRQVCSRPLIPWSQGIHAGSDDTLVDAHFSLLPQYQRRLRRQRRISRSMEVMGATWEIREEIRHCGGIHRRETPRALSPDSLTPWTCRAGGGREATPQLCSTASCRHRTRSHNRAIEQPDKRSSYRIPTTLACTIPQVATRRNTRLRSFYRPLLWRGPHFLIENFYRLTDEIVSSGQRVYPVVDGSTHTVHQVIGPVKQYIWTACPLLFAGIQQHFINSQ